MKIERKIINGQPDWVADDRPMSRMYACADMPGYNAIEKVEEFRESGINTFLTCTFDPFMFCWDGEDEAYFDQYAAHIDRLVSVRPDIKLILFFGSRQGAPYRWQKKYPDQLAMLSDGTRKTTPSISSKLWNEESTAAIRRGVEYFENSKYARNIIGYNLTMLGTE